MTTCSILDRSLHLDFNIVRQDRGHLWYSSIEDGLPFTIERVMVISRVPAGETRGNHGHLRLQEALFVMVGSLDVAVEDEHGSRVVTRLTADGRGILVPERCWAEQFNHSADCILLVLASEPYDPADEFTDKDEFKKVCSLVPRDGS